MKTANEIDPDVRSDEALEALFAHAIPRPLPPAAREAEIRERVRLVWQQDLQQRKRRHYALLAMAASLVVATAVGMIWFQSQPLPGGAAAVAMVEKRFGDLQIADASGVPFYPPDGSFALVPGQTIRTGDDAGLAMSWSNGGSLRLDQYTVVSLTAADEIYLHSGRIYFDSDADASDAGTLPGKVPHKLAIRTDHGVVTPLGTRYTTQRVRNRLVVTVRHGKVSVSGAGYSASALEGERLLVAAGDEPVVVPADAYGEDWAWVEKTSPAWNADGRTIFEFLDWVSRESGRPIRFDTPSTEQLARTETLVGYGVVALEPSVALRIVLMTTNLDWTIKDGAVVVSERQPDVSANSN